MVALSGTGFGGINAEPKGTFYLRNSGIEDAPFLTKLYDALKLPEPYRHGFSDVFPYYMNKNQQLLLRNRSSVNRSLIVSESLIVYGSSDKSFNVLGEVDNYNTSKLRKKLENLNNNSSLIYEVLYKDYYDRFIQLLMDKFDNGTFDPDNIKLTDAEAFYIVTGIKGTTSITNNKRNSQNIGSIFIREVDHSDAKKVTIHDYEIVRNDATDTHNATHDWLEVDRATGKVRSTIFE
jgi:hypothetical protein